MRFNRIFVFVIILIIMSFFLVGCAGNITVKPGYQPQMKADSLLASVSALKIKLMNFVDKRDKNLEAILIGRRYTAFNTPMGDVFSDRPVFEVVREALISELVINNHTIVTDNEDVVLSGEILKFWVGTDTTLTYWDIVGEVSIILEVKDPKVGTSVKVGPYTAKKVERTYVNPSAEIVERVISKSLQNVMQSMSSNTEFVAVLKKVSGR